MGEPTRPAASPGLDQPPVAVPVEQRAHQDAWAELFRGRNLLNNVVFPLILLACGVAVVVALGKVEPKGRPEDDLSPAGRLRRLPPVEVTETLSMEQVGDQVELRVDGEVVPYREVQIATEVAGRVIEKSPQCRAGHFVRQGQLLVRIDPTDYEQEVLRLTQVREQEYESLQEVDQELANAKATLDIAGKDIEIARRELARLRSLPAGFVSETEIDQAEKSLLSSQQSKVSIDNQMNLLRAKRGRLEASERLATTQLETARINLHRCEIRSPADGVIVSEDAELNSFIQRGSPIVTLEDVSKVDVRVNLRMDQLFWVLDQQGRGAAALGAATGAAAAGLPEAADGDAAVADQSDGERAARDDGRGYSLPHTPAVIEYRIAGLAARTYRWQGTLRRYDGIGLDSRSRTVPVRIEVDDPERMIGEEGTGGGPTALVRGMFVNVRLQVRPQTPLVAIPAVALRPGNRVWRFVDDPGVIDSTEVSDQAATAGKSAAGGGADERPAAASDDLPFQPEDWRAGRVDLVPAVTPVDVLWMADQRRARSGIGGADRLSRRYWLCAVPDGSLGGGEWLVVSPLGAFGVDSDETAPLAVRARRPEAR